MTSVNLASFHSAAISAHETQKLTIANGNAEVREAHTSLGGRLISWIKLNSSSGDAQKIADHTAFRQALTDQYEKKIGAAAYEIACNACGLNDGKVHSLTPELVLKAISVAEQAQLKKEGGVQENGLPKGAAYNTQTGVIQNADGQVLISTKRDFAPERAFVHYTVETNEDLRVTARQIENAAEQTLESQLDDIELKYGPEIAEVVEEKIINKRVFERLFAQQSDQTCAYQLDETVGLFMEKIWKQAENEFINSLPRDVQTKFDAVSDDLEAFSDIMARQDELDQLSERYGIDAGGAQEVDRRDPAYIKEKIIEQRRQLADNAHGLMLDKLSKTKDGLESITAETFNTLFAEAIDSYEPDATLLGEEHLNEVIQQTSRIVVEEDQRRPAQEPLKSALKSTPTNYEAIEQAAPSREEAGPRQRAVRFG